MNILTNFSKFEKSGEKLDRGAAKLEQMNWSKIFGGGGVNNVILKRLCEIVKTSQNVVFW